MEFFVDIVHAVSYSLLLLNTDLHIAELATHMSKSQFVRNTITAIQMQLRPNSPAQISTSDLIRDDDSVRGGSDETEMPHSKRSDSVTSWNSLTREAALLATNSASAPNGASLEENGPTGSSTSVHVTSGQEQNFNRQRGRAWESDMESLLKVRLVFSFFLGVSFNSIKQEMFNAIKNQQILQPINSNMSRSSTSSLSPGGSGVLRNRSLRAQPDRLTTLRRSSIRGLQSILSIQQGISPYSSNSSIDGRVSPSPSFATSTHEVRWNFFCPTYNGFYISLSQLYGSSSTFLNPTLGFASNLSHTIIREAQEDDDRSIHSAVTSSTTVSISDEELALLGAPWAKEGILCRKRYFESAGRRAKDKNWMDVFVVIQKGELNMFTFGTSTSGTTGAFGGGNWLVRWLQILLVFGFSKPSFSIGKRAYCRNNSIGPFTRSCFASAGLPQTSALHGPHHGQSRCIFLPSGNRRACKRVGVDVQLLGREDE